MEWPALLLRYSGRAGTIERYNVIHITGHQINPQVAQELEHFLALHCTSLVQGPIQVSELCTREARKRLSFAPGTEAEADDDDDLL